MGESGNIYPSLVDRRITVGLVRRANFSHVHSHVQPQNFLFDS